MAASGPIFEFHEYKKFRKPVNQAKRKRPEIIIIFPFKLKDFLLSKDSPEIGG